MEVDVLDINLLHQLRKNIDDVENQITVELKNQEEIIDEMYKEASYFEKTVRKEVTYSGYGKLFSSLLT